jgi:hypothetical protein
MVDALYTKIQPVAAKDNTVWKRGDGSRGYKQITEEFIPIRGKQLLQVNVDGMILMFRLLESHQCCN